jgi:hypothetical protein
MYAEISAAIGSTRALGELLKAAHSLHNYNEFVAAVSDVSAKLVEATAVALQSQEKHAELISRISELECELRDLKKARHLAQHYVLHKFETGALAYSFAGESSAPEHYACARCLDSRTRSLLQPYGNFALKCHACDSKIDHRFTPARSPPKRWVA